MKLFILRTILSVGIFSIGFIIYMIVVNVRFSDASTEDTKIFTAFYSVFSFCVAYLLAKWAINNPKH